MGLHSGGGSLAAVGSCGGGAVLEVPLNSGGVVVTVRLDGGGGGGHTTDSVSGESGLASLAPILGARVPVGRPCGPIHIRDICLYDGLSGVDRFVVFVYNGDHDHVIFFLFGDSFFSFPLTR
jgi:hypothetical protein